MKKVLYVPMLHDPWSPSANTYFAEFVRGNPKYPGLDRLKASLEGHWIDINKSLASEDIDRVYQDGFTHMQDVDSYMSFLSTRDEWNYDAVNRLLWRGALLTPTEDVKATRKFNGSEQDVMVRDKHIATNICNTMKSSGTAALFMGMGHYPEVYRDVLEKDRPPISLDILEGNIKEVSDEYNSIVEKILKM
jgi:hypothetical protein